MYVGFVLYHDRLHIYCLNYIKRGQQKAYGFNEHAH
jgi:hypothetical protein